MLKEYENIVFNLRKKVFASENIDKKIAFATLYGGIRWRNYDGVFQDKEIENNILNAVVDKIKVENTIEDEKNTENHSVTIIVSELYNFGGHTRVVVEWLKLMSPVLPHKLVVTRSIPNAIKNRLTKLNIQTYFCRFSGVKKIEEIVSQAKGSEFVVLIIHPDDVIAAVASRILSTAGSTIVFYNHADHVFSYGICSSDIVCEISRFGNELNKRVGRINQEQCWLGIPYFSREKIRSDILKEKYFLLKKKPKKTILSCGVRWKYKPEGDISFDDFIDKLLSKRKDVKVIIVGPTGKEEWWDKAKTKWKNFVEFFKSLPYKEYNNLLKQADLYVDSFPFTGGIAFPEALMNGVPAVGLKSFADGYSCADCLKVEGIDKAVERIECILDSEEKTFSLMESALNQLKEFNSSEAFQSRVTKLYNLELDEIKTIPLFQKEEDFCFPETLWVDFEKISLPSLEVLGDLNFSDRFKIFSDFFPARRSFYLSDFLRLTVVVLLGKKYKIIRKAPYLFRR